MSAATISTLMHATETVMGSQGTDVAASQLQTGSDLFSQIALSAPAVLADATRLDLAALHRIGVAARLCEQWHLAEMFYNRALELAIAEFGTGSREATRHRNFLAGLYLAWQRPDMAERYVRDSLEFYVLSLGAEHLHTRMTWFALALVLMQQGRHQESKEAYGKCHLREGINALSEESGGWSTLTLKVTGLAAMKYEQGAYNESTELFRYGVLQEANEAWPGNIIVARNLHSLAILCRSQQHDQEAEMFGKMSRAVLQSMIGSTPS